jgi:3-hydroxyacyl-[acyl-carrier-protein] dehydratase
MAPLILFDISSLDLDRVAFGPEELERINPHRGCMRLLDGLIHCDSGYTQAVAFKNVRSDEFWVPGHIPGRPIFPGVLMIEAAAQLASYMTIMRMPGTKFMGFAAVDQVKFRGMVAPGDRLIVLAEGIECKPRRSICNAQGWVGGSLVFEARITGMPM